MQPPTSYLASGPLDRDFPVKLKLKHANAARNSNRRLCCRYLMRWLGGGGRSKVEDEVRVGKSRGVSALDHSYL